MEYLELLDSPDWWQPFNGSDVVVTSSTSITSSTVAGSTPTYASDVPFGSGQCLITQTSQGQYKTDNNTMMTYGISIPTGSTYTEAHTEEFWIKLNSTTTMASTNYLLNWYQNINRYKYLEVLSNGTLRLRGKYKNSNAFLESTENTITTRIPLTFDEWHLVTLVYQRDKYYTSTSTTNTDDDMNELIYIDGILQATRNETYGSSNTYRLVDDFGNQKSVQFNFGDGVGGIKISNYAVWAKRAQSQKQIARRYSYGKGKYSQEGLMQANSPWILKNFNDPYQNSGSQAMGSGTSNTTDWEINKGGLEESCWSTVGKTWTQDGSGSLFFDSGPNAGTKWQALHATGNFTLEMWVRLVGYTKLNNFKTGLPSLHPLFNMFPDSGTSILALRLETTGVLTAAHRHSNNTGANVTVASNANQSAALRQNRWCDNDWHHVVIRSSFSGTAVTLSTFIDGSFGGSVTTSTTNPANTTVNYFTDNGLGSAIMRYANSANAFGPWQIDSLGIYTTTLSEKDIAKRYQSFAAITNAVNVYQDSQWKLTSMQKYYDGNQWKGIWQGPNKKWSGTDWVLI